MTPKSITQAEMKTRQQDDIDKDYEKFMAEVKDL
eukprot:CAMPEP_0184006650 /NCGR_PEP_ID=MMETSP0954-20121128/823_1 /TAXON_ID=627963 /ORGANISM="Aplanochytrium sp, Strain PBS07" /LENGTH=33 /DNA_ID= /DNA_START= /DNA_END= /DNA_ORIENTATION=